MKISRVLALGLLLAIDMATQAAILPKPPSIQARAYVLRDFSSGRVLAEKNADERMEPASLTKMMTSYVVFEELRSGRLKLDDTTRVSERAWRMPGSRMFIEVGNEVSIDDLLKGLIVQSGNDAATALAEKVAGDEGAFAGLMNETAKRLGMKGSNFMDASGLPHADHYTTARDMATLAAALIRDFPRRYAYYSLPKFVYNGITQRNRNRLLRLDKSVDGLKTGYTKSAGYNLVASAKRGEMRLISVVMGAASAKARVRQSSALIGYGFRFYETRRLYKAGDPVRKVRIWKGARERLSMGLARDLYVTVPRGRFGELKTEMGIDDQIIAPVPAGSRRGTLRVMLGKDPLAERPLLALDGVAEGSLWQRLADDVRLLIK